MPVHSNSWPEHTTSSSACSQGRGRVKQDENTSSGASQGRSPSPLPLHLLSWHHVPPAPIPVNLALHKLLFLTNHPPLLPSPDINVRVPSSVTVNIKEQWQGAEHHNYLVPWKRYMTPRGNAISCSHGLRNLQKVWKSSIFLQNKTAPVSFLGNPMAFVTRAWGGN